MAMDDGEARRRVALARKWLEDPLAGNDDAAVGSGHAVAALVLPGARVSLAEPGRLVCSLLVPPHLTDAGGAWHAGAVAAAVDNMCSVVVFTVVGASMFTVSSAMSYFAPAEHSEEVELDGRVVGRKGKLTAAEVQVRTKESGELVAIGRQWMTTTRAKDSSSEGKSRL